MKTVWWQLNTLAKIFTKACDSMLQTLSMASGHPPQERDLLSQGRCSIAPCLWLRVQNMSVCLHRRRGRGRWHVRSRCHVGSARPALSAQPPWAGAIFSTREMSQVWGQVDERDGTGDQGSSVSLREEVELDIQDLQACSSGCPRCL